MAVPTLRTSVWSGRSLRVATSAPAPEPRNSKNARSRILARHARLGPENQVLLCQPSEAEISGGVSRTFRKKAAGSDRKVIYPSVEAAEVAAAELEALGAEPQQAYVCPRSQSGHAHLYRVRRGERND